MDNSAQLQTAIKILAGQKAVQGLRTVDNHPLMQAVKGYFDNYNPNNTNDYYQTGQAVANTPNPLGIAHEGIGGMALLAAKVAQYNPKKEAMLADDLAELTPVVERYFSNKHNLHYHVSQMPSDEKMMRNLAHVYIDKGFAKSAPLDHVGQELINRINVDKQWGK